MPKLYYPTPDELRGDRPLWEGGWGYQDNRKSWFSRFQHQLVILANTDFGRDLLCLDSWTKRPYPVISIRKNMVQYLLGEQNGRRYIVSDVRIGAKWGNVIRYRWQEVRAALTRIEFQEMMAWPNLGASLRLAAARFTTTTVFPNAHTESTSVDGQAGVDGDDTWTAIRDHAGGVADDSGTTINCQIVCSATTDQWASNYRVFLLFDTSGIDDGETKDSATMEVVTESVGHVDAFSGSLSMIDTNPASNTAIVAGDYDSLVTATKQAADLTHASFTADDSTYDAYTLNATGLGNIDLASITKFGIRATQDVDNAEPTWVSNDQQRLDMRSADVTDTTVDPKLVVLHSAPFVPRVIIF